MKQINRKKCAYDTILNLFAVGLPIILLQLIVLPIVGNKVGQIEYGFIIAIISLSTVFSQSFGSALNNSRLINDKLYKNQKIIGDYNFLLSVSNLINVIIIIIVSMILIDNISFFDIITLVVISTFSLIRNYLIVEFRIKLNYKKILIENIIMTLGYLIGLLMFYLFGLWHFIYITGYLFSFLYLVKTTNLLKESYKLTTLFKFTFKETSILFISGLFLTSLQYTDKLIMLPLLGSRVVSVYYSASIIGKILMMVIVPLSSVILSYLIRFTEIKKSLFNKLCISLLLLSIPTYFLMFFVSKPALNILYPQWSMESQEIVPYILIGVVFQILTTVLNPIILKFRNISWQMRINLLSLLVYISFSILLYYMYGLTGFCIGISMSQIVRFFYIVYVYNFKK